MPTTTPTPTNTFLVPTMMLLNPETPVTPRVIASPSHTLLPEFTSTVAPSQTPMPMAIRPGVVAKDLLMTIVEKQFESIGILPVGETNPQIFLREPKHSFEYPVWSHSGDWIAFRQTDYGIHTDRPGIVRRDGTGKKIPDPIFGCMSPPTWSADDRLLGSIICTESGELPIVIDIETEKIFELFPNTRPRFSNSFPSQFGVSPKTMQAIFMGLVKGNPQSR
jgi:hypothetical protein